MAGVMNCLRGITLSGADNEELFRLGREHADAHHPDDGITDELIRGNVAQFARDGAVS